MRTNETAEQREARRVARVAKREAQQAKDEAAVKAALGEGWRVMRYGVDHRYIVTAPRPNVVTTVNHPSFVAPTLDEAIAQAKAAPVDAPVQKFRMA